MRDPTPTKGMLDFVIDQGSACAPSISPFRPRPSTSRRSSGRPHPSKNMLALMEPSTLCTALSSRARPCRVPAEDVSSGARAIAHQMQTARRIAFWHAAVSRATMWSRIWADSRMLELGAPRLGFLAGILLAHRAFLRWQVRTCASPSARCPSRCSSTFPLPATRFVCSPSRCWLSSARPPTWCCGVTS